MNSLLHLQKEGSTRKKKKQKKDVDPNKPKRPMTSYMMWFSTNRNDIKEKNPDASITDISKKGGELWRAMDASERGVSLPFLQFCHLCIKYDFNFCSIEHVEKILFH